MPTTQPHGSNGSPLIELREVVKTYTTCAGDLTVLRDVSLQVREGEFVGISGPSGSGKSTMLNMITGIDRPTEGEVLVGGQAVHKLSENRLARWRGRNVGIIFQFFQLLPALTILENVVLPMDLCQANRRLAAGGRRERYKRSMHLLAQVGIADQAHKLPSALHGGQQQRAAIARALANDPPLIVGDEPTGNLDTANAEEVFALFQRLATEGKTLVIVTHDLGLSARAGRVIHLLDGRVHQDEKNGGNGRRSGWL
jgi:putative ABC transport system ATP-binding protein